MVGVLTDKLIRCGVQMWVPPLTGQVQVASAAHQHRLGRRFSQC